VRTLADNEDYMLTTVDNPFDPFTQYDQWYWWDFYAGYHTPGALARIANVTEDMSDVDVRWIINKAIDEIVEINAIGVWRKVKRSDFAKAS
jgi:hypothetical protein